ncbi:MAG TPA: CpsD/CapB family tyrosine-protein kinase, partial [Gemmataceae bacterium]|nr:CpsD/CapB family tyrosine-protein kinase [Gemmataceae bacterium]
AVDMARAVIAPVFHPGRATRPEGTGPGVEPRSGVGAVMHTGRGYVLVVTSAAAGEGKTVLSGHLAVRLARSGRRTLVIDTDVRRPRIHELYGIDVGPGLGELLLGEATLPEVTHPGPVPGIDVIPAGGGTPHAVSELLEHRLPGILRALRLAYDVILLDTAPLLIAPETLTASRSADGVLLSVMRDVSRIPGVLASYQKLCSVNAPVLGAIVTGDSTIQYHGY